MKDSILIIQITFPAYALALKVKDILLHNTLTSCISIKEIKSFYR